ncbi:MAG: cyclophilin-like fold protein [Thermoplasmata archaeon]|nr:cyclophilin-like fold protein [Thermoplasmata archaeon]
MNRNALAAVVAIVVILACAGAYLALNGGETSDTSPGNPEETPETPETPDEGESTVDTILMTVGDATFTVTLADTDAARALAAMLPMTVTMSEYNGNEKYVYLDTTFPTAHSRVGTISAGDVMLYQDDCVVVFYESFSTSYSYTRLGTVDDPIGLAEALGSGSVTVTFSAA